MNTAPGTPLRKSPLPELTKTRDLEYFDGPLISEFKSNTGDTYIYYWCDTDNHSNRWMIFRVSQRNVIYLESQRLSFRDIILDKTQDPFVYFADIPSSDSPSRFTRFTIANIDEIPSDYIPEKESYLEPELMPTSHQELETYPVLIDKGWGITELSSMPKQFADTYALLYHSQQQTQRSFQDLPFRGGFSTVNFYNDITSRIPPPHKPGVDSMRYASPGYIRFKALKPIAALVAQSTKSYFQHQKTIDREYETISDYIRLNRLNKLEKSKLGLNPAHNSFLKSHSKHLLEQLGAISWEWLVSNTNTTFQATKITMAHYKRVRDIARLQKKGFISFT